MVKYIVSGIEKVRDMVEADDKVSAEMLFRARYPAVFEITEVRELGMSKPSKDKK